MRKCHQEGGETVGTGSGSQMKDGIHSASTSEPEGPGGQSNGVESDVQGMGCVRSEDGLRVTVSTALS